MIAESLPTWSSTLVVLSFFGTGMIGLVTLYFMWRQTKAFDKQTAILRDQQQNPPPISPQPLMIKVTEELHETFASKKEFDEHKSAFEKHKNEIWQELRKENQRIGNDVAATRESVASLEATTEFQTQQLTAIQSDIKQILKRS